ncbi:hypothetical protein H4Q26_000587 [Puccinia striiformis f. sp. tritici PST-130]|nr:hypothetical protein H4Q26_000587 [Puccinia striiformis f. sp. tritici PST-130]
MIRARNVVTEAATSPQVVGEGLLEGLDHGYNSGTIISPPRYNMKDMKFKNLGRWGLRVPIFSCKCGFDSLFLLQEDGDCRLVLHAELSPNNSLTSTLDGGSLSVGSVANGAAVKELMPVAWDHGCSKFYRVIQTWLSEIDAN